jgi:hypothetical protein
MKEMKPSPSEDTSDPKTHARNVGVRTAEPFAGDRLIRIFAG